MFFIAFTLLSVEMKIKKISSIFTSNHCAVLFESVLEMHNIVEFWLQAYKRKNCFSLFCLFCFFPSLDSFSLDKQ